MSFNTSHITLYRSLFRTSSDSSIVSIHLMLLFIGFRTETVISCIWVSIHLMLLFIPLLTSCKWYILCFNTSHVTLYLCKKEKTKEGVKVSIHLMLLFILFRFPVLLKTVSFNTSHVTLYQRSRQSLLAPLRVSIHLMLLFILCK